jgi:hypothetical protein
MGDTRRNTVFAQFITKNFGRKAKTILVVADGKGELARALANKGFRVRVVEHKPRFVGRGHKRIQYNSGWFDEFSPIPEDVIVAMHPDEATGEVILAAKRLRKPFAIVPCCIKGKLSSGVGSFAGWVNKLMAEHGNCRCTVLKGMNGKNVVIYGR